MADVHLFGYVRGRVVNHNSLRLRAGETQTIGGQRLVDVLGQKRRIEEDIDKARPGDLDLAGNAVEVKVSQDLLSNLSRGHAQFFRNRHDAIGLVVTKLYFC